MYTMSLAEMLEAGWQPPLNDYPIFEEDYREVLNNKILNHFLFREIGVDTPDRFSFLLHRKMWEIMPYYNKLYESELFDFNPLDTSDMREYNKDSRTSDQSGRNRNFTTGMSNRDNTNETGSTHKLETIFGEKHIDDTISHETGNEVTHSEYLKQGDKTNDNRAVTDQTINEKTQSNSLTTNDLQTDTEGESHSTGTTDTTGSKTTAFSDLPQANLNSDGGGGVSADPNDPNRYNWDYLTTLTHENTVEHSETTADQTTESHTTNTGTVNVDGWTDRQSASHTEGTELNKELWHENGTNDGTKDTTDDFTENVTGTVDQNTNTYTRDTSNAFANEKYHERNDGAGEFDNSEIERSKTFNRQRGRSGFSPSILLSDYRRTLLNIDMDIINQLEPLFMSIY